MRRDPGRYVRRQKTDRRDAGHILKLLIENRFPKLWVPAAEQRNLRQLVGGAKDFPTQWVMQREFPRALVLNPSGQTRGAHAPPRIFSLDNAFLLIEGHPPN